MFFVYQLAQIRTSIQFKTPHIRCIGFSETLDEARLLAKAAFDEKKMETRIMPCGKVFLAGKEKYEGLDLPRREIEQQKAHDMVDAWILKRETIIQNVEKEAKEKTILPDPVFSESSPTYNFAIDDTIEIYNRGFFGLAIVQDEGEEPEPAIIPLAFALKLDDLKKKLKDLKDEFKHFDMYAAETGIWLPLLNPQSFDVEHHNTKRQEVQGLLKW